MSRREFNLQRWKASIGISPHHVPLRIAPSGLQLDQIILRDKRRIRNVASDATSAGAPIRSGRARLKHGREGGGGYRARSAGGRSTRLGEREGSWMGELAGVESKTEGRVRKVERVNPPTGRRWRWRWGKEEEKREGISGSTSLPSHDHKRGGEIESGLVSRAMVYHSEPRDAAERDREVGLP